MYSYQETRLVQLAVIGINDCRKQNNNVIDLRLTTVAPWSRFRLSLWLWAQKSIQHVTPENGRFSPNPSLHSRPSLSCFTWNKSEYVRAPAYNLRPRLNEDTMWRQHCVPRCCPSVAKTLLRAARTQEMFLKISRNIVCARVARVAKRVNIQETRSRQQCCRHNVSSLYRRLDNTVDTNPFSPEQCCNPNTGTSLCSRWTRGKG